MKKIKYLLVFAMVLFLPFMISVKADDEVTDTPVENTEEVVTEENVEEQVEVTEENEKKVTLYLFRGEGCPHCAEEEEWLSQLAQDEEYSTYYTLVDFEVWNSEENSALMDKVADALGKEVSGVPFTVVGKQTFSGFSESIGEQIKTAIKEEYNNDSYEDVVAKVQNGTFVSESDERAKNAIIPIIIVSAVALITIIALIFFTKEK